MGGRWRTLSSFYNRITTSFSYSSKPHFPSFNRSISLAAAATSEIPDPDPIGFGAPELDPCVKIPVKAYFLSTRYLPNTLSFSSSLVSLAPFVILWNAQMGRFLNLVSLLLLMASVTVPFRKRRPCWVGVKIFTFSFKLRFWI